jgi:hypothetical protein
MIKSVNLVLEDTGINAEYDSNSSLVKIRVNEFILDEEKSSPGHEVYKEGNVVEVYPTVDEVKGIIKALQNILPEEEKQHEPIGFHNK